MLNRIGGLMRDAWYLVIVVLVASAVMWFVINPLVGVSTIVLCLVVFIYFAIMRYDDTGRERTDPRA